MSPIIGICGIAYCVYFVLNAPHTGFRGYLEPSAIVMVGLCPPSVMLLSHTLKDFFVGFMTLLNAMFAVNRKAQSEVINVLTHGSALVRTEGIGALIKIRDRVRYDMMRDGLSLIVNDFSTEEVQHNLMARIQAKQMRMAAASNLFENMSKVCPGVGMIGTLVGLISMLSNLQDPSRIGSGMAMALITTLYGLFLGTTVYGPFGEKIALEAEKMYDTDMMVLEGVLHLKNKKSSVHLKDIMKTYGTGAAGQNNAHAKGA